MVGAARRDIAHAWNPEVQNRAAADSYDPEFFFGLLTSSLSGRLVPLAKRRERTIVWRLRRNLTKSHGRSKRWLGDTDRNLSIIFAFVEVALGVCDEAI